MKRFVVGLVAVSLLSGCGSFFRDRSLDYSEASSSAPLNVADVSTRPIKPLYPIPAVSASSGELLKEPPFPPEMTAQKPEEIVAPLPDRQGRLPVKLGTDGNGVPELRIVGPRERVWDELQQTLKALSIEVTDRNQSLGIVNLKIDGRDYQLRMVRGAEAHIINLQRDENALAPVALSRNLLSTMQVRWP